VLGFYLLTIQHVQK